MIVSLCKPTPLSVCGVNAATAPVLAPTTDFNFCLPDSPGVSGSPPI